MESTVNIRPDYRLFWVPILCRWSRKSHWRRRRYETCCLGSLGDCLPLLLFFWVKLTGLYTSMSRSFCWRFVKSALELPLRTFAHAQNAPTTSRADMRTSREFSAHLNEFCLGIFKIHSYRTGKRWQSTSILAIPGQRHWSFSAPTQCLNRTGMVFSKAPKLFVPISDKINHTLSCKQRSF